MLVAKPGSQAASHTHHICPVNSKMSGPVTMKAAPEMTSQRILVTLTTHGTSHLRAYGAGTLSPLCMAP